MVSTKVWLIASNHKFQIQKRVLPYGSTLYLLNSPDSMPKLVALLGGLGQLLLRLL